MAAALFCWLAGYPAGASQDVQYGPPADWVAPAPAPTNTAAPSGAPIQAFYFDWQIRLGLGEDQTYTAQRLKILTPEGLAVGNLALTWNPGSEDITIHGLKITREDRVIDVLATTQFQVIQREDRLDYAMLDGKLTATMQIPGLQVGDEFEFAATVRRRDPVFGDRSSGLTQLPMMTIPGAYRARFTWPDDKVVHWRVSPDMVEERPVVRDGRHEVTYEIRDPKLVVTTDGAPARFNVRRLIEYSGFTDWSDVSDVLWPLFDKASTLPPDSPVRGEAARIAASTPDPAARAEAALALVQDRIRYVYVGLDGGNYRPAGADETWNRRFGDCKAKTALLIALLRELGIASEAVLVNSMGGDGIDQRLPTPAAFDHVLVRATVNGRAYWLDGTHIGERLETLPPPVFRWALPLRSSTVHLEAVAPEAPKLPDFIQVLDVDARAGFDVPAKVATQQILRGEGVVALKTRLSAMAPEDAQRAQDAFWRQTMPWAEPGTTDWRYDAQRGVMVLSMTGEGKLSWEGDALEGRRHDIFDAGFIPPTPLRRPKEQDQTAPWVTNFPSYRCWATTIKLPPESAQWRWSYDADPVNQRLGGIAYWRQASLEDGVMRTVMSKRTDVSEISPAEVQELNDAIPTFNKYVSSVYQIEAPTRAANTVSAARPAASPPPVDWSGASVPCMASDEPPAAEASRKTAAPDEPKPAKGAEKKGGDDAPGLDGEITEPRQDLDQPITQPPYPFEALYARQEGSVILGFTVRKDGSVDAATIKVDETSGYPILDIAAMNHAATWRFLPATRKGEAVDAPHQFRVVFEIRKRQEEMPHLGDILPQTPAIFREDYQFSGSGEGAGGASAPAQDSQFPITQPPYPADAVAAGQEGDVILQFTVEADGFVDPNTIVVKKSSGFPSLDQAAVNEAAVNWRFRPAMQAGKPVAAPHRFRVVFALDKANEGSESRPDVD